MKQFLTSLYDLFQFLESLGVETTWQYFDVFGLDPELLAILPQPVIALLLLFPVTEKVLCFFSHCHICIERGLENSYSSIGCFRILIVLCAFISCVKQ